MQKLVARYFPVPQGGEEMLKVMPLEDLTWQIGPNASAGKPKQVGGFVARAQDVPIGTAEDMIEKLRLDYPKSPFSSEKGFATIEYINPESNTSLAHPFLREQSEIAGSSIPYTNTGMTGSNSRIIPEYVQKRIDIENKASLRIYDKNGKVIKAYEYDADTFKWDLKTE